MLTITSVDGKILKGKFNSPKYIKYYDNNFQPHGRKENFKI